LAEARVNSEAKVELENLLGEAGEKENMLIKTIEELRHFLTRQEQEVNAEHLYPHLLFICQ
jgi:TATA element modulatory factor